MVTFRNLRDSIGGARASRGDFKLAESLLKAVREHAVKSDPAGRERFQGLVGELNRQMVSTNDDAELLMIAGAAQQALRQYETEANGYWHGRMDEFHGLVGTLTEALAEFGERNSQAADRLMHLELSLESISRLEDLKAVRQKIEQCVAQLRTEQQNLRDSQRMVRQTLLPKEAQRPPDPATGLASRQSAEDVIAKELHQGREDMHLALFVIHRIHQVNARYGHAVGDEMLKTFLQHIAVSLRPEDQIFRWSGPAFLSLIQRDDPAEAVEMEMRRIASYKIDKELEFRDRSVMVPLSASVCVIPLAKAAHLGNVSTELDQFAIAHLQR